MVRETRHLWVGNLPENIREERIREHFKRYGRVQSVKLLPRCTEEKTGEITMACTVAFMDIKSASKAHNAELKIDDRTLNTEYYEPAAIPSATASPQNTPSPYSTSPGTTRFPNGHGSTDDHGPSTFPDRCFYERSSSSTRLVANTGTSITESTELVGRGSTNRGNSTSTTVPTLSTYHETVATGGGGRSSSSSSSSTAPSAGSVSGGGSGRNRERSGSYRNGPYGSTTATSANVTAAATLDGRHSSRASTNNWGYDSTRYNSSNSTGNNNQTDTGYSTLSENERRNLDQSSNKKKTSRSGSRSPSPSGSTSSRSPSRSRSRSSSSSSSSSMSRDTSSTGSPKSKRLTSSSGVLNSNHQPVVHSDDRRPLAICVKNLPVRSSDTSLKDGLFHEYKKHGKVTWVKVVGKDAERHAIVCFKKPEDVEKALEVSYDKLFFGCKIEVAPYQGYDVEDNDLRPYEAEIDEYHPKATRTLFIGNLEKDVTASDLRKHFDQFGEIIEIDIKKQGAVSSYAFCQYSDIVSVVKAIRKMDGEHLGNNRIKLGFGKSMPYNCVWIDGINENVNEKYLKMQFEPFGVINKLHIDREKGQALIFYEQVVSAQTAVTKMRGFSLKNNKIQVDFASRECQESFFERLEKQGANLERTTFEERREPVGRPFDIAATRFSRYDTASRPRTASYSSRSNPSVAQVATLQSPGTPGSVTPRGSRSRTRFYDYDPNLDYGDRHFRSYDEYSQSSTASHEDLYDHEYGFVHDAADSLQAIDNVVTFAPPDMRNLQKERVHLLEQLEECPSSGDELISPKKRMKLDLLDPVITSEVIIEANRDHRKVMEVRRLSDVNLKHHSRRPSMDSGKHVRHEVVYVPHSVCKRRKTAGSDSGSKLHHYDHSGSESVGGSRPGTPLCDERPENFQPTEPRRIPREREGPLTLPLPRFAAQIMNRGPVSVAGIKGQKDNILSSPPPAVTSPRISNPRPPSPVQHVPPPASPPPRPPSLSSNSSDSELTPPSPSLEERIKSLDEKYEKWSGSRALSAAGGDALALLDANLEKFRQRHKILELDLKEVQPSEIVKSVLAKRSVFDEDLKRLENVGEKYEPKDFSFFPRSSLTTPITPIVPPTPTLQPPPPVLKINTITQQIPKTPTMLSPRSTGTSIPTAKGLQYPFPTHPPNMMSMSPHATPPPSTTTSTTTCQLSTSTATTTTAISTTLVSTVTTPSLNNTPRGASHGDNRLKPCPSVPSDVRTSSKLIVNKTNIVSVKNNNEKTNLNIPNTVEGKFVRDLKAGDKISARRDSSSSNSPRADVKTRRNSDTSARRCEESAEQTHTERAQSEERKRERIEKIKVENEKLEKEKLERERIERERYEVEKQEKLRIEKEKLERERLERESELEKQRLEKERLDKLEKERVELEKQKEKERFEKEEIERRLREAHEKECLERERKEEHKREEEEKIESKCDKERDNRERVRHKEDNHDKRKDEHKHRELHNDNKHKENHRLLDNKSTKESSKDDKINNTKDSHESRSNFDKSKIHADRDSERRKESIKENRDNNIHEKHNKIRDIVESRHMSIDTKSHDKHDPSKRKERNNSLPATIGSKRRFSSNESMEMCDDNKKIKLSHEHKKMSERRDSKDSNRSEERLKSSSGSSSKHKQNNINKSYDKYSKDSEEKRKEREERHRKHKLEKQKSKSKSREKESVNNLSMNDKEFLSKLELKSDESDKSDKHKREKEKQRSEDSDKIKKEKCTNPEKINKVRSDSDSASKTSDEKKKHRIRKLTNTSDSDSDEPKKHSIFDIVDDEPAYISMYDKVKARSCKNMAKQEEEKRQEKLKAKFTQLKQSRAKREEKKRSTSWDEDSDSDKDLSDIKVKRCPKMLIDTSDDESQDRKLIKKKEIYSDSDSSIYKHMKQEIMDTSEDEIKNKSLILKSLKPRITSDTSEDERNKKKESDYYDDKSHLFEIKDEPKIKKESNLSLFSDNSDNKQDKYNNKHLYTDITTDDESHEAAKKERAERREKKHKKKQKKQKHSVSSEESTKFDENPNQTQSETDKSKHEKKKEHSKKEKRRDKNREGREKSKKSKKNKFEIKDNKREGGKMENIFGSLSEDSDVKEPELEHVIEDTIPQPVKHEEIDKKSERDKEKEEHKRKKEKKRREKERRLQEAAAAAAAAASIATTTEQESNENSMDYIDMGKQLEANMMQDDEAENINNKNIEANIESRTESLHFESNENKKDKEDRRENKEKKKKRKRSKDEKSKHHNHHHDKNKIKSESKKDQPIEVPNINHPQDPSLPNILEESSPVCVGNKTPEYSIPQINPVSPIPKTPSTQENKREKLIPGFGTEIDAVKSISVIKDDISNEDEEVVPQLPEEKPRVVISQEETEDAVAALLGESFSSTKQEEFYNDENSVEEPSIALVEERNVQDDEEMRQAVQSLSATDLDIKPDTPQSEHDLQIDTDTEEQEDIPLRFQTTPKTPESVEFPQLPKTPDLPPLFTNTNVIDNQTTVPIIKSTNIGSPPSLTPIRPTNVAEKRDLPVITDQPRAVSQPWQVEQKIEVPVTKSQTSVIKIETKKDTPPPPRSYSTPVLKVVESQYPPLKPLSKTEHLSLSPVTDTSNKVQNITKSPTPTQTPPQLHNLPARSPVPTSKTVTTPIVTESTSRIAPTLIHNRMPITSVMVPKPLQATTVLLQQSKIAHTLEPPKLVPTSQDRPRMVFQTSTIQSPQFANKIIMPRHLHPSQGLLVPTRNSFNYNLGNVPHSTDNISDSHPKLLPAPPPLVAPHIPLPHLSIPKEIITTRPLTPTIPSPKSVANSPNPNRFSPVCVSPQLKNSPSPKPAASPDNTPTPPPLPPTPSEPSTIIVPTKVLEVPRVPTPKSPSITATSTPSPVIVSTQSVIETVNKEPEEDDEKPMKLAIEAVTEELNLSLEKTTNVVTTAVINEDPIVEIKKEDIATENKEVEVKEECEVKKEIVDVDKIEKLDVVEEKNDIECVKTDVDKEVTVDDDIKEDPLDTKEDNDYWSTKEAVDSVIKTLVSSDELSDQSNGNKNDDKAPAALTTINESVEKKLDDSLEPKSDESVTDEYVEPENNEETKEPPTLRSSSRRGGRGRGRGKPTATKAVVVDRGGIQTRRGKLKEMAPQPAPMAKRGRGGKTRTERKSSKSESESPADVYEFRDEPDDSTKEHRPRLILTIKSPAVCNSNNDAQTTAIVKEVTKDGAKEIGKEQMKEPQLAVVKPPENKEEFASPSTTNTRKSRRLQEKDTFKNTVDDTIEDVVKNTVQTRASANQRRSGRQVITKQSPPQIETPRKSPRSRRGRRGSEATENSSSEETSKEEVKIPSPIPQVKPKEPEKPIEKEPEQPVVKEKPHEGLKAAVLRRIKGEMMNNQNQNPNEPTNLIDPVTGELIPMRESEEGKYVPLPGSVNEAFVKKPEDLSHKEPEVAKSTQPTVITQSQPITVFQQPKPQSLKAHVLSSQAAQAVVAPTQTKITPPSVITSKLVSQESVIANPVISKPNSPIVITKSITPIVATKTVTPTPTITPISQHLTINTNLGMNVPISTHLSPRPTVPLNVATKPLPKQMVKNPMLSPILMTQQKQIQQIIQTSKQQPTKAHVTPAMVTQAQAQIVNTQMAHMKHQQPPMIKQQVILGKAPLKPIHHTQQQIIAGAVQSPPLGKSQSAALNSPVRNLQMPPAGAKGVMEPPKVDVSMGNVMMGQRPKLSPQGTQRIMSQTGLPIPGYEPNLHGERSYLNRSRSPPPAHQNSPSPKGEAIAHFPPGPLRPPELNPSHYMHPSHVMQYQQYQQYLKRQHLQFSRSGGMEKVGDGQEGEEAPVTSPPLELRRPGSVGLALSGRSTAVVPHSLHSPHDRTTDSPQIGQIYNVHSPARNPYHHPSRYFDQEPPPAHRPLTSHGSLAALGSDRGLAHMAPIGTPDRPLSSHSALSAHMGPLGPAERSISTHIERPLSAQGIMGAGLGAAGNIMGAVARHIGADAPTSQRGLQAATPPHASQVPPQAESLLMLLKQYPCMWQGLLALKNDQAAVQMYFVSGNDDVARSSLPKNTDGSTPPLRIFQRMRLEPPQVEGVARKIQMENEHCMLLALPCGHDHMDVLKQSTNLTNGFITYLQQKQAAGIINVAAPGTTQPPAYVVHIFPSCDFVNENLRRIAPSLLERVADIAHLLIVITTV